MSRRRVLLVANDRVGSSMAGPGIRYWRFAQELAREFDVTLSVPFETDLDADGFHVVVANPWQAREMTPLVRGFDAVVTQRLPVPTLRALAGSAARTIFDLYAPLTIENLAFDALAEWTAARAAYFRLNSLTQELVLLTGDAFVCASEKQRDLWLGSLLALGRLDHETCARDPSLRDLLDVVPFGVEPEPPRHDRPVLRGVVPGIGEQDTVLLWGGGIWNWFDPLTPIRAVDELRRRRDDVRLFFLGIAHPNPHVPAMAMTQRALDLSDELGLTGRYVFFNEGWVPYAERGAYLLEADLGVSAHFNHLEPRFAFRTRLVDCFWAGLPVVTTEGDSLADLIEARGLGRTLPVGDVAGWVEVLDRLIGDPAERAAIAERMAGVRAELAWPRVVEPLARLLSLSGPSGARPLRVRQLARYGAARIESAVAERGLAGTARRALQLALPRSRPPLG